MGLRDGLGALHLRHRRDPQGAGGPARRLPRHRGHDPVRLLLRRQRRPVRDPARRRRTRSSPTSSTTRASSTAYGCARRSGYRYANRDMADLEAQLQARGRRALPADRHRRRVLDGRLRRPAGRDRRPGRAATTPWSWSTTRTRSASSARPGPARRSCSASRTGSTSSPARSARPSAAPAAATPRRRRDRRDAAPAVPAVSVLQLRWPRRSPRRAIATLDLLASPRPICCSALRDNTAYFRAEMTARGFDDPRIDHPIVPVMIGDAVEAAAMADRLLAEGIYVRAFSYPGGAARQGPHPDPDVGRAHQRRPRSRHRGLRQRAG